MEEPIARLEAHRIIVRGRLDRLETEIAQLRRDRVGDSSDDEHDPEGVTLSAEWSRLEGLRADAQAELDRIEATLVRARDGTYGICVDCGDRVAAGRLEALPGTDVCVTCAARREKTRR